MEFRVLGPLEVRAAGRVVGTGHSRQRAVLAVLLLDLGHVTPAQVLIDRVWGEDPPASVRNVLYGYVARLRTAIAEAGDPEVTLARRHGGYLLQARPERLDLHRFRRLVAEAVQCDDERGAAILRQALALWHGPALAGADSSWLAAMRRTLESERLAAQLELNDIRMRQGEHNELVGELAGQAATGPADERLTGQLMLALWRSGRAAEALRCFEQAREYLAHELGADPGPQLQALHQQILRGDASLTLPDSGRGGAPAPRELPADVPAFTGRIPELDQLDQFLLPAAENTASGTAVIAAVSGTAGVGKTALALHWAHRAAGLFPDGQLHVDLRGYDVAEPLSPAEVLARFLRALGVTGADIPSGQEERAARYRSLLAGRRMLVVLDNASTVDQVRPLLPGTATCATIVTSRDSLAGLVAREGAARLELDLFPLGDAVDLLRELVGSRADADPGAAAELAGYCARLPLALRVAAELAAARGQVALADLVTELSDQRRRLDLLNAGGDPRTAVRAVFSWSYRNLDPQAARAFRLLGLHPGVEFDRYAVAALTGAAAERAADLVSILSRAHLLQPAGSSRYGLHDLLRAYARELAAAQSRAEREHAVAQLLDCYLYTAAAAMDVIMPGERHRRPRIPAPPAPVPALADPAAARGWLDDERANLVALVRYAEAAWPGRAIQLAATLFRYLDYGGHWAEAATVHDLARRAARRAGDHTAEAEALNNLGVAELRQGRNQQAEEWHRQALALSRRASYQSGAARALNNLGLVYYYQGRYAEAADRYQQALTESRELGDQESVAGVLGNLAVISQRQGHDEQAVGYLEQGLALFRETGNRNGEATTLGILADTEQRRGRYPQAAALLERALALFREGANRDGEASALDSLAGLDQRQGHYEQAAGHCQQALKLFRETGNRDGQTVALNGLGHARLAAGQYEDARAHYSAALDQAHRTGSTHEQAHAHNGLARVHHAAGQAEQARYHWQQALSRYTALGVPEADQVRARLELAPEAPPGTREAHRDVW